MYYWWWVRLSPETCRVKPLRRIKTQLLHLVGLISLLYGLNAFSLSPGICCYLPLRNKGTPMALPIKTFTYFCVFTLHKTSACLIFNVYCVSTYTDSVWHITVQSAMFGVVFWFWYILVQWSNILTSFGLPTDRYSKKVKVKQSHYRPWGFQEVKTTRFQDNQHMKVARLSALRLCPHTK